jgi:hypothetical protein
VFGVLLEDFEEVCFDLTPSKVLLGKLISLFCDVLHLLLVRFHILINFKQVAQILRHGVIVLFMNELMKKPLDFMRFLLDKKRV